MPSRAELKNWSYWQNPNFMKGSEWKATPAPNASISPLIRTARWAALGLGIAYGAWRFKRLSAYEESRKDMELRAMKEKKEAIAADKARRNAEELTAIGEQIGGVKLQ